MNLKLTAKIQNNLAVCLLQTKVAWQPLRIRLENILTFDYIVRKQKLVAIETRRFDLEIKWKREHDHKI